MDTVTLRIAFGLVAGCVLALFYGVTFRSTRSAYSGWWCLSLGCFMVSAALFVLNHTPFQVVANPLGNATGALGAACVWAGARSLRGHSAPTAQLVAVPVVVLAWSLLDDPVHDVWSGGVAYLVAMAALIGRSSLELVLLLRERALPDDDRSQVGFAVGSMAVASGAISAYYAVRTVVFVVVGPEHVVFRVGFGGQVTTLATMLLLVVVTFGMSAIGHAQQTSELRVRATRDSLTGLLNRAEFLRIAEVYLRTRRLGPLAALVIADLDRFKRLNDDWGHAAGDQALADFGACCSAVIDAPGLAGRLGGDEFVLLVPDDRAEQVVAAISSAYAGGTADRPRTVSFGVAAAHADDDLSEVLARADDALYRAKDGGRAGSARWREPGDAGPPVRRTA